LVIYLTEYVSVVVATVALATWADVEDVAVYAYPDAAYGAVTAPDPPDCVRRIPNCSEPAEEFVFAGRAVIVFNPEVRVAPCTVSVYPVGLFVCAAIENASASLVVGQVVSPGSEPCAKHANEDDRFPKNIVASETENESVSSTVADTATALFDSIGTDITPVSPKLPVIETYSVPAVPLVIPNTPVDWLVAFVPILKVTTLPAVIGDDPFVNVITVADVRTTPAVAPDGVLASVKSTPSSSTSISVYVSEE